MPHVSLRNYVGVAARGTVSSNPKQSLFSWDTDRASLQTAERRVMHCVEMAMQKYNISSRRIFLAGLEEGGTMALRIGLQNPDVFAGALSLGGAFPKMGAPLSQIHKSRTLPLFMTTTRDSVQYPVPSVCDDLRLFHTAGLHVTLRQYPGADEVTKNMLSDMDRWLMDRISQDYQPEVESFEPTPTPGY
jgi:predicted esterase